MNVKEELKLLADEKYRKFHSSLCPGTNNILGIRIPILRNYAKELSANHSLEFLLDNIDDEYNEEIMLKGMIIGLNKNLKWDDLQKYIKDYVPKINNWGICDCFCAGLKISKRYKEEMWNLINKYLKSDKEFEVRFAIVMILDYYIDESYLERNFEIFNNIKLDKYYVKMAVAWAISICVIKFYDETIDYLKYKSDLDDWTYNKAIRKAIESYRIENKQKEFLRKMKK